MQQSPTLTQSISKVTLSIEKYKRLLSEQGYSKPRIQLLLLDLLHIPSHHTSRNSDVTADLLPAIKFYLAQHQNINKALTSLLVQLEYACSQLQEEQVESNVVALKTPTNKKAVSNSDQKAGKENSRKKEKKTKKGGKEKKNKGKVNALEEVKSKNLIVLQQEQSGLRQNMEQIRLLKNLLSHKIMLGHMGQQPLPALLLQSM